MDQHALTKRSAERAIALGFPGWQPYFFGGAVYALGGAEDRVKAVELLREAKRRSGPPVIDRLLADLGARD